ncbi:hypothetical protein ACTJK5_09690 [Agrobacterium sp. 22094]|uniref:phage tail tube protein n=1 Tax=Agrobacterium sp. 22094 TaxID=3453872 RepID=UPI003F86977B
MANIWQPIVDNYAKYSMQVAFQPQGDDGAYKLGDLETATMSYDITEIERWSREDAMPFLARTDVTRKGGTLNMTIFSITEFAKALMAMDDPGQYLTQAAVPSVTKIFPAFRRGRIYSTGVKSSSITEFKDTDDEEYILDTDYRFFGDTGDFEWIGPTTTTGGSITVSGSAITATAGRQELGILAGSGQRGRLVMWGTNEIGKPVHVELWSVKLTPTGEINLHGGDDYTSLQVQAKLYGDATKEPRFRYGRMIDLAAA